MSTSREDLYQEAMGLDPKERADLIAMLLASMADGADSSLRIPAISVLTNLRCERKRGGHSRCSPSST